MKYVQPVGEADPNASYKDRNTGAGEPGSRVPAKAIENPQREIVTVLTSVGLVPNGDRVDQLNEAIDLKIDLATGGGENPLNDLLNLLRARLLFYPEILTVDGKFNLSVPSTGSVRIPAGIEILHRGVFPITTAEQTFATAPNKTYHMRYRFTGAPGWSLVDVYDSGYNPDALDEDNSAFDTVYDDMITHKVTTDASNVATVTSLVNRHILKKSGEVLLNSQDYSYQNDTPVAGVSSGAMQFINWARRPQVSIGGITDFDSQSELSSAAEASFGFRVSSRYSFLAFYQVTGNPNRQIWMTYEARG